MYYAPFMTKFVATYVVNELPILNGIVEVIFPFWIFVSFMVSLIGISAFLGFFISVCDKRLYFTLHNTLRCLNSGQMFKAIIIAFIVSVMTLCIFHTHATRGMGRHEKYNIMCHDWMLMMFVPFVVLLW